MNKILSFFIFLILIKNVTYAQTFCLNFEQVSNNGIELVVDLQIAGSTNLNLGSSNFQFTYNGAGLSSPTLVSTPISTPSYQTPTFTTPASNTVSFNIELNFAPGFAVGTTFTDFARVKFNIINPSATSNLQWSYNGGTTETVVFLDNESTQIYATNSGVGCVVPLNITLPVKLTHFQAEAKDVDALLSWQSESEHNLSYYDIERSTDQRNWQNIGKVDGKGDNYTTANYQWADPNILRTSNSEYLYYRLKMVDTDAASEYSPIRSIRVLKPGKTVQVQPNPAANALYLVYDQADDTPLTISMYDNTGKLVLLTTHKIGMAVDVSALPRGVYSLQLTDRSTVLATERVVLQ